MATVQVTGIGGVFLRARDPEALRAWYETHFGIAPAGAPWMQQAGPTVVATFSREDPYLGGPEQAFMLNLRVADLDAAIRDLSAAGIAVETRAEWDGPHGRFGRLRSGGQSGRALAAARDAVRPADGPALNASRA